MNYLKEILFPGRCPVCDTIVGGIGRKICEKCYRSLKPLEGDLCCKCGKKLWEEEKEYCRDCSKIPHTFDKGMALYEYMDIASSIYRFKYEGRQEYAEFFGKEMAYRFGKEIKRINPDVLIPVPLHKQRKRRRGFNQAELLAKVLGKELKLPVDCKIVIRQKNTLAQKHLNAPERQNNLKKAFKIAQNEVKLSTIIIIDDIYTTGSTIDAVAQLFKDAGVKQIYFVTLAIGKER